MTDEPDLGALYRATRERLTELAATLDDTQLRTPVPGCPQWEVRDVLAHLAGIVSDALSGTMRGAPGDAWTAKQVEARRAVPTEQVLAEWSEKAPKLEPIITANGIGNIVADITTHEQDIRGALDLPGARDEVTVSLVAQWMLDRFAGEITAAGLPAVLARTEAGDRLLGEGEGEPPVTLTTTSYELVRGCLGRRSRAQLAAMGWDGDPAPYLDHLTAFTPSQTDIIE